ncbi:AAA family ATPase [Euhalothece natronophila]|uniref:AAA family ATPase n=1 Tax=Euhalothece natronophila TaxID=577489 RepID=UPI001C999154|nr:AAA family ATPase [Euhalothece natronophila]
MSDLDTIIKQSINPFDTVSFKQGNFWEEEQSPTLTVNSIHQEEIKSIATTLAQVAKDKTSRTILLKGDSGSGKTHLLGQLKKKLNNKAFFAHIIASIQNDYIFQYTLRKTIESLMFIPEGEKESQLLLWLKNIINKQNKGVFEKLQGQQKAFVSNMKAAYPSGIWKPNAFFRVLYALTQPELYYIACDWLKGDDIDEEDAKALGTKERIKTEQDAIDVLASFSRISSSTLPIVLCFDEIDISNNRKDLLESILKLNMIIKTQKLKNFLVIVSVITDTWQSYEGFIESSLKSPINQTINLKPITSEQIKSLWSTRLSPLHQQVQPQPKSNIAPLTEQDLRLYFPSGKGNPRSALRAGHQLIQKYKTGQIIEPDAIASFKLLWQEELNKNESNIKQVSQLSSAELINMLKNVMEALQVSSIQFDIFNKGNSFATKSFYYFDRFSNKIGVIWYEEANLGSFCTLMKSCEKLLNDKLYQKLVLIRARSIGNKKNKGYKLYQKIFNFSPNYHIIPDLKSVQILATYHNLYSYATNKNLTVGYENPNIIRLQELVCQAGVLKNCDLLKGLNLIQKDEEFSNYNHKDEDKNNNKNNNEDDNPPNQDLGKFRNFYQI